jgi:hypothetical protein
MNRLMENTRLLHSLPQEWQRYDPVTAAYVGSVGSPCATALVVGGTTTLQNVMHPDAFEQPEIDDFLNSPINSIYT